MFQVPLSFGVFSGLLHEREYGSIVLAQLISYGLQCERSRLLNAGWRFIRSFVLAAPHLAAAPTALIGRVAERSLQAGPAEGCRASAPIELSLAEGAAGHLYRWRREFAACRAEFAQKVAAARLREISMSSLTERSLSSGAL